MKRFLMLLMTGLTCYFTTSFAEDVNPIEQMVYDLMICEEIFHESHTENELIASSALINELDQSIQAFCNTYSSLNSSEQTQLLGVMQYMVASGFVEIDGTHCYPAYSNQVFLEVLLRGLIAHKDRYTSLVKQMNEFVVENLRQISFRYPGSSDLDTLNTFNDYLTQLSLNPNLIQDDDFLNNLYQSFNDVQPILSQDSNDFFFFNMDLVGADLFDYHSPSYPPTPVYYTFQNATELQSLMISLLSGTNLLFYDHMLGHLQMGINSVSAGEN